MSNYTYTLILLGFSIVNSQHTGGQKTSKMEIIGSPKPLAPPITHHATTQKSPKINRKINRKNQENQGFFTPSKTSKTQIFLIYCSKHPTKSMFFTINTHRINPRNSIYKQDPQENQCFFNEKPPHRNTTIYINLPSLNITHTP